MALSKFSTVITATSTVFLPDAPKGAFIEGMALTSLSDTSVGLTVTDVNARTIATWASADYTTRNFKRLSPAETNIFDTGGDASADTEHSPVGIIADGPLTLTLANLGAGELLVEVYYRPIIKDVITLDTTLNTATVFGLAGGRLLNRVLGMALTTTVDTTVSLTVTDAKSRTVATWASADYTTRALRHLAPLETDVLDSGGDASADTEGNDIGVLTEGALTFTTGNTATAGVTVEVYTEA